MTISWTKRAAELWRLYETDGLPLSGVWKPYKPDIQVWGGQIEDSLDDHEDILAEHENRLNALPVYRGSVAFSLGDSAQTIPSDSYTKVAWSTVEIDTGSEWDSVNKRIVFTRPGWRHFTGQLYVLSGVASFANGFVCKLIKNGGADVKAGIGTYGIAPNISVAIPILGGAYFNQGDYVEAFAFITALSGSSTLDKNPAHIYLQWHEVK